jgi:hypothetical protein
LADIFIFKPLKIRRKLYDYMVLPYSSHMVPPIFLSIDMQFTEVYYENTFLLLKIVSAQAQFEKIKEKQVMIMSEKHPGFIKGIGY